MSAVTTTTIINTFSVNASMSFRAEETLWVLAIGVMLMMGMALVQYQLLAWEPYALIGGLFVLGQVLEGYVLTPNLVGNRVGLHPLWVMFALLAGGSLGGIGGMLMSIPCAVVVSVVLPRVLRSWREAF